MAERTARYSDNWLGRTAGFATGVARGVVALGEGGLRAVNYAANWGSVTLSTTGVVSEETAMAHAQELAGSHETVSRTYNYLTTGGASELAQRAKETVTRATHGDVSAIGDIAAFGTGLVGGTGATVSATRTVAQATVRGVAQASRTVKAVATGVARGTRSVVSKIKSRVTGEASKGGTRTAGVEVTRSVAAETSPRASGQGGIGAKGARLEAEAKAVYEAEGYGIIETQYGKTGRGFDFAAYRGRGRGAELCIAECKAYSARVPTGKFTTFGLGKSGASTFRRARSEALEAIERADIDDLTRQMLKQQLKKDAARIHIIGREGTRVSREQMDLIEEITGMPVETFRRLK